MSNQNAIQRLARLRYHLMNNPSNVLTVRLGDKATATRQVLGKITRAAGGRDDLYGRPSIPNGGRELDPSIPASERR
jgi:hypothetical protein